MVGSMVRPHQTGGTHKESVGVSDRGSGKGDDSSRRVPEPDGVRRVRLLSSVKKTSVYGGSFDHGCRSRGINPSESVTGYRTYVMHLQKPHYKRPKNLSRE